MLLTSFLLAILFVVVCALTIAIAIALSHLGAAVWFPVWAVAMFGALWWAIHQKLKDRTT